jgi:hypothetical protein
VVYPRIPGAQRAAETGGYERYPHSHVRVLEIL